MKAEKKFEVSVSGLGNVAVFERTWFFPEEGNTLGELQRAAGEQYSTPINDVEHGFCIIRTLAVQADPAHLVWRKGFWVYEPPKPDPEDSYW